MTKNKLATLSIAGIALMGAFSFGAIKASAETVDGESNFISALASKLGLSEDTVKTAVTEVRSEKRAERQAEMETKISEAVTNGDLTQTQADILNAMQEIREEKIANGEIPEMPDKSELENLTSEERQAKMEELRAAREQEMLDALAEKGFEVTSDELDSLHETLRDLGIGMMGLGGRGHGGPRGGGMMF